MNKIIHKLLIAFSFLGMAVTAYLIHQHFAPVGTSVCNFNDYVSCDIVNKSEYSEILGIPVSILGFLSYVGFFVYSIALYRGRALAHTLLKPALAAAVICTLFSAGLTYIEFYVLYAVCVFCLSQQLIILLITLLLASLVWKSKKI